MASKNFSQILKELRLKAGYTQKEVYEHFKIPQSTFSSWEVGKSEPSGEMLIKLCDFYKCDMMKEFSPINNDILTAKELRLIERYRQLDTYGIEAINSLMDIELRRIKEKKVECFNEDCTMPFPYFSELPVSAGNGEQSMDIIHANTVYLKRYPPKGASFIIRVSGDSMEPEISDGDKIFIKKQPSVEIGEIGAFFVNGNMYIKELGQNKLISLNEKYKPIKITEYTMITCYGKYVGKCEEEI